MTRIITLLLALALACSHALLALAEGGGGREFADFIRGHGLEPDKSKNPLKLFSSIFNGKVKVGYKF